MDSERLNRWLTLVSNFAVIAGIVFLAIELRQNTQQLDRAALILSAPGVRQWWDAGGKTQLSPSFVEFLDSLESEGTTWFWNEEEGFTSDGSFEPNRQ